MPASAVRRESPATREDLAATMGAAAEAGSPLRLVGGATKLGWGAAAAEPALELSTARLDGVVEHNAGDLTAVLEAGVPLATAQAAFAREGQMLSLDPPDGGATIGGVVATNDSGPLRSRYGGARDLVVGARVALSDGTIARSGGKVIKNVAGYDVAKLFCGSFGTLGAIVEVSVRLHPLPPATVTAVGTAVEPEAIARAANALARAPLEHHGFDVRWEQGRGTLLVRFAGAAPRPPAEGAAAMLREAGLHTGLADEDGELWDAQRDSQRSAAGTVVRVSGVQTQLPAAIAAAERAGATLVGRVPLGLWWLGLDDRDAAEAAAAVEALRRDLHPSPCVVLDAPAEVRAAVDPWGPLGEPFVALMRRLKERFDPAGVCAPGTFAGGI
jgi:glycolate oxidase FAD binding subunit